MAKRFTNDQVITFYKAANYNKSKTADLMKINRSTLHRHYINTSEHLRDMMKDAEESRLDFAEQILNELVTDKNFYAIKFILETKGRERGYGAKIAITHDNLQPQILNALERKYENDL